MDVVVLRKLTSSTDICSLIWFSWATSLVFLVNIKIAGMDVHSPKNMVLFARLIPGHKLEFCWPNLEYMLATDNLNK